MGRNRSNNVRDYFVYEQSSNTSTCTVDDCFSVIKGDHNGNLLKHLQASHSEIYEKVKSKSTARKSTEERPPKRQKTLDSFLPISKVNLNLNSNEVKKALIESITVDGRPLSIIEDVGLGKILKPVFSSLNLKMDRYILRDLLDKEYIDLKKTIINEMKDTLISIKIDAASCIGRSVLGDF